jgi:hypothetical protein
LIEYAIQLIRERTIDIGLCVNQAEKRKELCGEIDFLAAVIAGLTGTHLSGQYAQTRRFLAKVGLK